MIVELGVAVLMFAGAIKTINILNQSIRPFSGSDPESNDEIPPSGQPVVEIHKSYLLDQNINLEEPNNSATLTSHELLKKAEDELDQVIDEYTAITGEIQGYCRSLNVVLEKLNLDYLKIIEQLKSLLDEKEHAVNQDSLIDSRINEQHKKLNANREKSTELTELLNGYTQHCLPDDIMSISGERTVSKIKQKCEIIKEQVEKLREYHAVTMVAADGFLTDRLASYDVAVTKFQQNDSVCLLVARPV